MVQPVLIRPIPCLQHHHGLARNDATRVTGTRSSSACLSTALSVCLYMSICLPAHLSVCLAVNQSRLMLPPVSPVCLSVLSVCLSTYLSVYLSLCLSVRPSAYLSVLSVLSICPRERWGIPYRDAVQRLEPRCRVRSVAECGCTRDE